MLNYILLTLGACSNSYSGPLNSKMSEKQPNDDIVNVIVDVGICANKEHENSMKIFQASKIKVIDGEFVDSETRDEIVKASHNDMITYDDAKKVFDNCKKAKNPDSQLKTDDKK